MTHAVGVIGAGAWGTALAVAAGRAGRRVDLWGRTHNDLIDLAKTGQNRRYLPGIPLTPLPHVTRDLAEVMNCGLILLVVPAQQVRSLMPLLALSAKPGQPIVLCAKGIERGSGRLMSEVVREFLPNAPLAALSGPTFAGEVAQGLGQRAMAWGAPVHKAKPFLLAGRERTPQPVHRQKPPPTAQKPNNDKV